MKINNTSTSTDKILNEHFNKLSNSSKINKWKIIIPLAIVILVIGILLIIKINIDQNNEHLKQMQIEKEQREKEEKEISQQQAKEEYVIQAKEENIYNLPRINLKSKILDVPITYQYPDLPSACEILALTNILNYYKFNLDKYELLNNYLVYDYDDWVNYYSGDPYSYDCGGAIMAPGITSICQTFLNDQNSRYQCYDVSGRKFEDLFAYIERDIPVQIWVTIGMEQPSSLFATQDDYCWYDNNHSVVLSGFDEDKNIVYISDSIDGQTCYDIDTVKSIYEQLNSQAVIIA